MFNRIPLFVGLRYFFASSGNRLVSFISGLAVTGLVCGVALLIVVLAVMNGFDRELRTRILDLVTHIQVYEIGGVSDLSGLTQRVQQRPGVLSVTPFTEVNGMLTHRGRVQPVVLHGERFGEGNPALQSHLKLGAAEGVNNPLFISQKMADKLNTKVGDHLRVVIPAATDYSGGGRASRIVVFTLTGVFNTGTELDQHLAVTRLSVANELAGLGENPQALQVQVDDVFAARQIGYRLQRDIAGVYIRDWSSRYGNLYQAIQGSRNLVLILIFLIVAIAAFNVISMLVMAVIDKRPAIAILKTLGCSNTDILGIFFVKGSLIGLMGCVIGTGLGVLIASYVGQWAKWLEEKLGMTLLNTEVYPVDVLPSHLLWSDVGVVVAVAFTLNMLATLHPAWRAGKVRPADELRYE
ncbi:FtsX-like permease family protein [bacterium SCSIO 12696]|nr:FtsX-like permease family protein [bacterium SCSIO 12696]